MSIVCAAGMAICYSQFGRLARSTSDPGSIKSAPCRRTIVPVIGGVAPEGAVLEFARAIVNRRVVLCVLAATLNYPATRSNTGSRGGFRALGRYRQRDR